MQNGATAFVIAHLPSAEELEESEDKVTLRVGVTEHTPPDGKVQLLGGMAKVQGTLQYATLQGNRTLSRYSMK